MESLFKINSYTKGVFYRWIRSILHYENSAKGFRSAAQLPTEWSGMGSFLHIRLEEITESHSAWLLIWRRAKIFFKTNKYKIPRRTTPNNHKYHKFFSFFQKKILRMNFHSYVFLSGYCWFYKIESCWNSTAIPY